MNVRPHLESLPPYTPIEPFEVLSGRVGRASDQIVKLDANENPYGPLPAVRQALGALQFPHIYPDPESRSLRAALADFTGVPVGNLLAGAAAERFGAALAQGAYGACAIIVMAAIVALAPELRRLD